MAAAATAPWFETRGAAVLTMRIGDLSPLRIKDLILRSIAKRCVSKDEAATALPTSSSRRTPGPIRRAAYFERRRSTAIAQPPRPVVMGPRFRGDDGWRNADMRFGFVTWQR